MDFFELIILFLSGTAGGILAGLLGIGGGVIYIFVLSFYFNRFNINGIDWVRFLVSNSVLAIFFAGLGSSIKQYRSGNFYPREVLWTSIPAVFSVLIISYLISSFNWYSAGHFSFVFILLLLFFLVRFLYPHKNNLQERSRIPAIYYPITGFFTGILSGLSGLGGGIIMVPFLSGVLRMKIKKVTSISQGVMPVFTLAMSLFYAFSYSPQHEIDTISFGYIVPEAVLPLSFGSILGAPTGVWLATKLADKYIKIIFAVVLMTVSLKMILDLCL